MSNVGIYYVLRRPEKREARSGYSTAFTPLQAQPCEYRQGRALALPVEAWGLEGTGKEEGHDYAVTRTDDNACQSSSDNEYIFRCKGLSRILNSKSHQMTMLWTNDVS